MAYLVAGIDIGSRSLKVALGKAGVKKVRITDLKEIPYSLPEATGVGAEEVTRALGECFKEAEKKPEVVVAAVPGSEVFVRFTSVPKAAIKKLEQVAIPQVEDDLPIEVGAYVTDVIPTAETEGGRLVECVVAAAKKETLRALIRTLEQSVGEPAEITCGLTIYHSVLAGAVAGSHLSGQGTVAEQVAIIDIGHTLSTIVFLEGGRPRLYRSIRWGGRDVTLSIASAFAVSFSDAEMLKEERGTLLLQSPLGSGSVEEKLLVVCREAIRPFILDLRQAIMAAGAKFGTFPHKLYLCGGTASLNGIREYLQEALGIETDLLPLPEGVEELPPKFACAAALVADFAEGGQGRINFRKGELAFRGRRKAVRRRWARAVAAASATVVGWLIFSISQIASLEHIVSKQRSQLEQLTEEITGERTSDFSRAELILKRSGALRSPVPAADAFDIIHWMSQAIPEEVVHDIEELDIRPERWRMRGIVDTIADRDKVYDALVEYKDCIKTISKGKTTLSAKDNRQKYHFDMETKCP